MTRVLGDDHRNTLITRGNLAEACVAGGRVADGIALHERVLRDSMRILGEDDPVGPRLAD